MHHWFKPRLEQVIGAELSGPSLGLLKNWKKDYGPVAVVRAVELSHRPGISLDTLLENTRATLRFWKARGFVRPGHEDAQ